MKETLKDRMLKTQPSERKRPHFIIVELELALSSALEENPRPNRRQQVN